MKALAHAMSVAGAATGPWLSSAWSFAIVALALTGCREDRDRYTVRPGLEPPGTFAIEGVLRGDPPTGSGPVDFTLVVDIVDEASRNESGGMYRAHSTDGSFRVAGLACPGLENVTVSVQTDDGRGGRLHPPAGSRATGFQVNPGDRLVGVRMDMTRGWSFRGTVRDDTGALLEGVSLNFPNAVGRYGNSVPWVFTRTDAHGAWILNGVRPGDVDDPTHPLLSFNLAGRLRQQRVPVPSGGELPPINLVLPRNPE